LERRDVDRDRRRQARDDALLRVHTVRHLVLREDAGIDQERLRLLRAWHGENALRPGRRRLRGGWGAGGGGRARGWPGGGAGGARGAEAAGARGRDKSLETAATKARFAARCSTSDSCGTSSLIVGVVAWPLLSSWK